MKQVQSKNVERYGVFEVTFDGKTEGNPFVDAHVSGTFSGQDETIRADGFYDGGSTYKVRFMPSFAGRYTYRIEGSCLDEAIEGEFDVDDAKPGNHGPVSVSGTSHFAYADETVYTPFGTTCYVWTHQEQALQQKTLDTLRQSAFNKIRFCIFPKHYLHNFTDPVTFPYEGTPCDRSGLTEQNFAYHGTLPGNQWDYTRFNVDHFRKIEQRIMDLMEMGIEADLIVMHPYDCWGFSRMSREQDQLYWEYVIARFSAFRNVWWSLANEYDFLPEKTDEDWLFYANLLIRKDPYQRMRSVHNGTKIYDFSHDWVTHCSIQSSETQRTQAWRDQFQKPVVIDEMCYEGDIDQGWGNITAQEMSHRCWDVALRGGYIGHGETYVHPRDILWWSHGGDLHGESEPRIAFLRRVLEAVPGQQLKATPYSWDCISAGPEMSDDADAWRLIYFGIKRPSFRNFHFDDEHDYQVEIIDTWNMTIEDAGTHRGWFKIPLPARQYIALRIIRKPE